MLSLNYVVVVEFLTWIWSIMVSGLRQVQVCVQVNDDVNSGQKKTQDSFYSENTQ